MGGLGTGNTYRKNYFAIQQLPGKRWEVGNGTVPLNSTSPPHGVSDNLFVEDLAKSKLLYRDILSSLFLFTPITPWFSPTPRCNVCFPGTEGTQESKRGAAQWDNVCPGPALTWSHSVAETCTHRKQRTPESHSSGMFFFVMDSTIRYCSDHPCSFPFMIIQHCVLSVRDVSVFHYRLAWVFYIFQFKFSSMMSVTYLNAFQGLGSFFSLLVSLFCLSKNG